MSDTQTLPDGASDGTNVAEVYILGACPNCNGPGLAIVKTTKDILDGATQFAEKCVLCGYVSTTRAWVGPNQPVAL